MTRRLLFSYLTIAALVLLLLEVPLGLFYQQRETARLGVGVERDATVLSGYYEDAMESGQKLDPAVAERYAQRTGARVVIVDQQGRALVDTAPGPSTDFASRPEFKTALAGHITTGQRHSDTLKTDLLYAAVPIASGGVVHGALRLTMDTQEVMAAVHRFWLGLAAVAAVVLLVVAFAGWAIARSMTRPLRTLHTAAARFATGDLTPAAPDPGAPREFAELGATMNTMAARLARLLAEQRAFVADASHQLRTPLTALRLRLENTQNDVSDEARAEDLGAAVDETDRLTALVADLLRFARAEQTAPTAAVDLRSAAADRVDTWAAMAEAAGVGLELAAPSGPVMALAVPDGVEQILDNLIDNAVSASPGGARVTVSVSSAPGPRFAVADEGSGLSDEQKARALERFWRGDDSRPGTGLGLPIARALAEASGGSLTLADRPGGGLLATVTLPPAPAGGAAQQRER